MARTPRTELARMGMRALQNGKEIQWNIGVTSL